MASSAQLEQEYQGVRGSRRSLGDLQKEMEGQMGLGARRESVDKIRRGIVDTQRLIDNVGNDVTSRTRQLGGPVTQAVRNRMESNIKNPLINSFQNLSRSQGVEESGIRDVNSELSNRIALEQQMRTDQDNDFIRRIGMSQQDEQMRAQRAAAAFEANRMSSLMNALNGGGATSDLVPFQTVDKLALGHRKRGAIDTSAGAELKKIFEALKPRGALPGQKPTSMAWRK
jgi:hypothetical protein